MKKQKKLRILMSFFLKKGKYWMDNVMCDGREAEISQCRFDGWGKTDCKSSEAAGVICVSAERREDKTSLSRVYSRKRRIKEIHQGGLSVRLGGSRIPLRGRLEVKLPGSSGKTPNWNWLLHLTRLVQFELLIVSLIAV